MKLLILFLMIYCHIIDDYKLQGILANLKQKEWWQKNAPNKLYKEDYKIALLEHSFCWSISIILPLIIITILTRNDKLLDVILCSTPINMFIHSITDDLKANEHIINLQTDQLIHIIQIIITWLFAIFAF